MAIEFRLPDIGEGLADGEIVKWLVSEGDHVAEDQPLVEVLTDKATVEIPSPHGGRIIKLCASEGEVVAIGATIMLFAETDEESAEDLAAAAPETPDEQASQVEEGEPAEGLDEEAMDGSEDIELARELARAERSAVEAELVDDEPQVISLQPGDGRILATPATRRLANELGVDIALVSGSGIDGRVMKEDVRAFVEDKLPEVPVAVPTPPPVEPSTVDEVVEEPPAAPLAPPTAIETSVTEFPKVTEPPTTIDVPATELAGEIEPPAELDTPATEVPGETEPLVVAGPSVAPAGPAGDDEERVPLRGLRRTIAERMVVAKQTAPHYTYVEEADMEEVVHLRAEAKSMAAEHGVKLTYLPFIVRALALALKKHPYLNASLDHEAGEIVLKRRYNIGIATATEGGLIVPVIRDADALGLFELASEIQRLSGAARDGSITLEDLQGGTFTITSTGNIGGLIATPILNLPEVAILGVTAIRKRPVVRDDQVVIRHMVNFSLTLDHRVVDGAVGALFMRDLVKLLEDPKLQLLANL